MSSNLVIVLRDVQYIVDNVHDFISFGVCFCYHQRIRPAIKAEVEVKRFFGMQSSLWMTNSIQINIYTVDDYKDTLKFVKNHFDLEFNNEICFIPLRSYWLTDSSLWPVATLIGMSLASTIVAIEAIVQHSPDILVDTVGHAFIYPVFRILTWCKVACYVHYPTISTDMLTPVLERNVAVNNSRWIASSNLLTVFKLQYYKMFSVLYYICGQFTDLVMVNSTWTRRHIEYLWRTSTCKLIFPPCDVHLFANNKTDSDRKWKVISVAQFRPEKRLEFQVEILKILTERHLDLVDQYNLKWVFVGGCRNSDDEARATNIRRLVKLQKLDGFVEFHINVSYEDLKNLMHQSRIGIHTMHEEHFGIAVVECMAAGLIMIGNASGGPHLDIIVDNKNGYTANTAEEYVNTIVKIISMSQAELSQMKKISEQSISRFDSSKFRQSFRSAFIDTFITH
ncbi:hypothetical protein GJ496_000612 [Pomphorhynchus laevis]|nr:hypothetical protein GJ496_000612 [Pomphorhynchus laevis]